MWIFKPFKRRATITLLTAIIVTLPLSKVLAGWSDKNSDLKHQNNNSSPANNLQDHELAYGFLATGEALEGQLGETYRGLSHLGQNLKLSMIYIMHNPDGSVSHIELNGLEELKNFIDQIDQERNSYAERIHERGFLSMAPKYDATVSNKCTSEWFEAGMVAVQQSDFHFVLKQGEKAFNGAIAGLSVSLIYPGGQQLPLMGKINSLGHIELSNSQGTCKIRLSPFKGI